MPNNRLTVGFEYRYKVIKEIIPGAKGETYGGDILGEQAMRMKTRIYTYWFILTGATGSDYIYKCVGAIPVPYKEKKQL